MVYFCTKCQKEHADAYKMHWRYKKKLRVKGMPKDDFRTINKRLDLIENTLKIFSKNLKIWALFMDRKAHYWKLNDEFKEILEVWKQNE